MSGRVVTALGLVTRFLDGQRGTWLTSSVPAGEDHAGLAAWAWVDAPVPLGPGVPEGQ